MICSITEDGRKTKTTQQTHYMLMSLREAYNKFKEEHPTIKVGLSKFYKTPYIKLFDHLPHQVCPCSYHENVRLLLVALRDHSPLSNEFSLLKKLLVMLNQSSV